MGAIFDMHVVVALTDGWRTASATEEAFFDLVSNDINFH